jgi:hypothetical protein
VNVRRDISRHNTGALVHNKNNTGALSVYACVEYNNQGQCCVNMFTKREGDKNYSRADNVFCNLMASAHAMLCVLLLF